MLRSSISSYDEFFNGILGITKMLFNIEFENWLEYSVKYNCVVSREGIQS